MHQMLFIQDGHDNYCIYSMQIQLHMFHVKDSTARLILKDMHPQPTLGFRDINVTSCRVLKDNVQQDDITRKAVLKAKPFTIHYEDSVHNSRKLWKPS